MAWALLARLVARILPSPGSSSPPLPGGALARQRGKGAVTVASVTPISGVVSADPLGAGLARGGSLVGELVLAGLVPWSAPARARDPEELVLPARRECH